MDDTPNVAVAQSQMRDVGRIVMDQILHSTVGTAQELTSQLIPVIVLQNRRKAPKARPDGETGQWIITDPEDAEEAFKDPANIGILLGPEKDSPVISVGLDLYKDRTVADRVKELGVTSEASIWIERSGRGGINIIYTDPGVPLQRDTTQQGAALDLMTRGYVLVTPSDTSGEPQGGGPYTWIAGHSPWNIPLTDLEQPPAALLDWWMGLHRKPAPASDSLWPTPTMPSKHQGPIAEGQRNTELASRAGYLHRVIPNDALVSDLVHAINLADCKPPLALGEVENILKSILPRAGASHLRGVPRLTPLEVQS